MAQSLQEKWFAVPQNQGEQELSLSSPIRQSLPMLTLPLLHAQRIDLSFGGERPVHGASAASACGSYLLVPEMDQGQQYALAQAFDEAQDAQENGSGVEEPVNPFYGIPFGVSMLVARRDEQTPPAGYITFRRSMQLVEGRDGRAVRLDIEVCVHMVDPVSRGYGVGTALSQGVVNVACRDVDHVLSVLSVGPPAALQVRFAADAKSNGGKILLTRMGEALQRHVFDLAPPSGMTILPFLFDLEG